MAPNTKQLSLIVKHLSAADLGVQKPVFAPLTQESNLSAPQEACHDVSNYWDWSHEPNESDHYWDWSSNPKEEVVSTARIISNLVKFSCQKSDVVSSGVDSNDYWDDRSSKDREPVKAQHADTVAADYWEWNPILESAGALLEHSSADERSKIIAAILHDERVRQLLSSDHIVRNLRESGSRMNPRPRHTLIPLIIGTHTWLPSTSPKGVVLQYC